MAKRKQPVGPGALYPLFHPVSRYLGLDRAHRALENPHAKHKSGHGVDGRSTTEAASVGDQRQQDSTTSKLASCNKLRALVRDDNTTWDL